MLILKHLTIQDLKNHTLIDDVSFSLGQEDKLAIIGEEGNGKSTLLKAIYDTNTIEDYTSISGTIDMDYKRIGYLSQHLSDVWMKQGILDYLLKDHPEEDIAWERYNELVSYEKLCTSLKIPASLLRSTQMIQTLSGGEKVKLQLLKLMYQERDLLLLDEPTNDLDIPTLQWLENFILKQRIPVIFISHDEALLSRCANRILHLEQLNKKSKARYTDFHGGYDAYVHARQQKLGKDIQIARKEKQEYIKKKIKLNDFKNALHDALNDTVRNPGQAAMLKKKMANIKAQERRFDEDGYSHVDSVEEAIDVVFEKTHSIQSKWIINDVFEVCVQGRVLIKPFHMEVLRKDKVFIVGANGCGKTLWMKQLYAKLKERSDITVGYMPQNYMDLVEQNEIPTTFLLESGDRKDVSYSRELLGRMKFTSEEMIKPIHTLSEGQKAKLYLLNFIKRRCNVLLLDEPTRNLSPLSAPIIRSILEAFDGCIIAVSHDRTCIKQIATRVLLVSNQEVIEKEKENELF